MKKLNTKRKRERRVPNLEYHTCSVDDKEDDSVPSFILTKVVAETPYNELPPLQPMPEDILSALEGRDETRSYINRLYHSPLA